MKIRVDRVVIGLNGSAIEIDGNDSPPFLREFLIRALNFSKKDLSPAQTIERYRAMQAISMEDEPDIPIEMLAVIKENLPVCFRPLAAAPALLMLEGKDAEA